ncbi:hypothetical protein [uncultured Shimia sp.]|uniref:hypothetical protein n=1 Tax=uncultured Shimia sp. TaxID=573152 RepID=UPI00260EFC6F|nr:hypothetical protein [uncultured Shimia sp.]
MGVISHLGEKINLLVKKSFHGAQKVCEFPHFLPEIRAKYVDRVGEMAQAWKL